MSMSNIHIALRTAFVAMCTTNNWTYKTQGWVVTAEELNSVQFYLTEEIIPSFNNVIEINQNGRNRASGTYQITIYNRSGNGVLPIETVYDTIRSTFARGNLYVQGAQRVIISNVYSGTYQMEADWTRLPVNIIYRADFSN